MNTGQGEEFCRSKVTLIFPPIFQVDETEKEALVSDLKSKAYCLWLSFVEKKFGSSSLLDKTLPQKMNPIPLGLLSLSGYLKDRDIHVRYIHCDYLLKKMGVSWIDLLEYIAQEASTSNVCGIYSTTPIINQALQIAEVVKLKNREAVIVLGGPHVTFVDIETINQNSFIDFVVRGEGEETFYEIIKNSGLEMESRVEILGTTYRSDGVAKRAANRPFLPQAEIPSLDFTILPKDFNLLLINMYSRGCPYVCSFCAEGKIWKRQVRFRDPQKVADELMQINSEFGQDVIHIADSEIDASSKRLNELLDAIESRHINCLFTVNFRSDAYKRIDDVTMSRMINLGFVGFLVGAESGSDYILNQMNRKSTYSDFLKTIDLLNRNNAKIIIPYLMLGFPGETEDTLKETQDKFIELLEEDRISFLFPKIFIPYPGTDPYEKPEAYSIEISKNWNEYSRFGFPPPFSSSYLSNELLSASIIQFYERIYNSFLKKLRQN